MSFLTKLKYRFQRFMIGRYGADKLNLVLVYASLVLMLLSSFLRLPGLSLVSEAMLIYALFRMLSKNTYKRSRENARFQAWRSPIETRIRQAYARFKNRRIYRYVKCPSCKSYLKVPRGAKEGTMTCGKCRHQFKTHG